MRWFLTADETLIPEKSIVKIARGPDSRAQAYSLDQRGVLGVVTLEMTFEEAARRLDGSDQAPEPATQPPARRAAGQLAAD